MERTKDTRSIGHKLVMRLSESKLKLTQEAAAKKKAEEEAARKKAAEEAAAKKKAEEEADRKKAEEKPLRKIEFAVIGKDDSKEGFVNAEWKYVLNKKALKAGNDRSGSIGSSDINSEALLALDGYDWNTIRIQNGSIDGSGFENRWRMSDHRDVRYKLVMKLAKAETKKPTVFIKPPNQMKIPLQKTPLQKTKKKTQKLLWTMLLTE